MDSETVPDQAMVGQLLDVGRDQVGKPAERDDQGSSVLEFDNKRRLRDGDGSRSDVRLVSHGGAFFGERGFLPDSEFQGSSSGELLSWVFVR